MEKTDKKRIFASEKQIGNSKYHMMHSKKIISKYLLCVLTLLGFVACDNDKTVWLPSDSSFLSSLAVQESMPEEGRPYLLACPLHLSEHATGVAVEWKNGAQESIPEDSCRNGFSYKTFCWEEAGPQEVTCTVSYTYGDERKSVSVKGSFYVIPELGEGCFYGDSKETIMQLHPNAEVSEENSSYITLEEKLSSDGEVVYYDLDSAVGLCAVYGNRFIPQIDAPYDYMLEVYDSFIGDETSRKILRLNIYGDMSEEEEERLNMLSKKISDGQALTSEESAVLTDAYLKGWISFNIRADLRYPKIGYSRNCSLEYVNGKHGWTFYYEKN